MTDDLRTSYRAAEDHVPALGDYAKIVERGESLVRKRRLRFRAAVLAGVTTVAAAVVTTVALRPAPTPSTPTSPPAATGDMADWAPNAAGGAAQPGSLMYRTCSDSCQVLLRPSTGEDIRLSKTLPDVASRLESADLDDVTLSFDGQWLGLPTDAGYEIVQLAGDIGPVSVPAAAGERWSPVGWTLSSHSLALARYTSDGSISGYALVILQSDTGEPETHVLESNPAPGWIPVTNGGDSIQVAEPVTSGRILSEIQTKFVYIDSDEYESGEVHDARGGEALQLGGCLAAGETLAGSDGVPSIVTPPVGKPEAVAGDEDYAVLAFDAAAHAVRSVVSTQCLVGDVPANRYQLPSGEDSADARIHPVTTTQGVALIASDEQLAVTLLSAGSDPRVLSQLPVDAGGRIPWSDLVRGAGQVGAGSTAHAVHLHRHAMRH